MKMKTGSASVGLLSRVGSPSMRFGGQTGSVADAVLAFEREWERGAMPSLEDYCSESKNDESVTTLAALVKADLRCRFTRGQRPSVVAYLDRFPCLREAHDRVVSLVYEEYCLREEKGERLDPERFCADYEPWRDSLASQLRYHRLLSQVVTRPGPPPQFPEPGETFQGFLLHTELGRGGVARVYLATEQDVGDREVALKVSTDRGMEASIQGRLDHSHIVPVLSVTPNDPETGLRGMCMPYRAGSSLDEVIRWVEPASRPRRARVLWDALASQSRSEWEKGPTSVGWHGFPLKGTYAEGVAWVVLTVARALEHAHSQGVLHRDVKPANVLLTVREGPQILDFNLAHDPHAVEQAEAALRGGTLPYMAPEQLEAFLDPGNWMDVGAGADLYALGLLLTEMLTGRRPEAHDPTLPLPRAIRELLDRRAEPHPSIRALNPTVPHALDAIAARCLALSPKDRYSNAAALSYDLELFLEHRPLRNARNTSKAETARNWTRRNRVAILCGFVLAVGSMVVPPVASKVFREDTTPAETFAMVGHNEFAEGLNEFTDNHLDKAKQLFERALQRDPSLCKAYFGLARVASKQHDYEHECYYLTKALELAESAKRRPYLEDLAWMYQSRAAARARVGQKVQRILTPEAFLRAAPQYEAALKDVEHARLIGKYPDTLIRFDVEYDSALAEMGLGDVASKFDKYEDSVAHFQSAARFLNIALQLEPRNDIEAPDLEKRKIEGRVLMKDVELRLKVDTPLKLAERSRGE